QLNKPRRLRPVGPAQPIFPSDLEIIPSSRWPTRVPDGTVERALGLPVPVASPLRECGPKPATVVVVTYNGLPYTKMCFASLLGNGWHAQDELIVVDNGSTDGTVEYLNEVQRRNAFVRLFLNEHNRGFPGANNQALREAKGDTLILLNND